MSFYDDALSRFFNTNPYQRPVRLELPASGSGSGGGVAPPARTPAEHLARLQSWFGDGTTFNWTHPPTPLKRGVFPTRAHISTWYDSAIKLGYTLEDIGFSLDELLWLWAPYAREKWPTVYANYNRFYGDDAYPLA